MRNAGNTREQKGQIGSGTGSGVYIDCVSAVRNSRMNCEVCRAVVSAQIQSDAERTDRTLESHLDC